jgi:alkylation response protein AidB-like acyl-CoA dehydrogenase
MTDGAARVCELLGDDTLKKDVLPRLISRDPELFWMSGQWMTERPGGSDVSETETKALEDSEGWRVHGFKWFSSATDADMTMLLARTQDEKGEWKPTSLGLSLFWAPMRTDGVLNGIKVHRLKQKYGTKAVPTAELELQNMRAYRVGSAGRGVASIATILNITRIHSAISGAAYLGRGLAMAKQYAATRLVHGKSLLDHALHTRHLADLQVVHAACTALAFYAVSLLGKTEVPTSTLEQDVRMLRLTTPLAKLWISKKAVGALSECMEAMGGQGYMEDVGLARHLRDEQVNTIWEGTTNVLALDVWRVFQKDKGVKRVLVETVQNMVHGVSNELAECAWHCTGALQHILAFMEQQNKTAVVYNARGMAFALAQVLAGALLVQQATKSSWPAATALATRFCATQEGLLGREFLERGRDARQGKPSTCD